MSLNCFVFAGVDNLTHAPVLPVSFLCIINQNVKTFPADTVYSREEQSFTRARIIHHHITRAAMHMENHISSGPGGKPLTFLLVSLCGTKTKKVNESLLRRRHRPSLSNCSTSAFRSKLEQRRRVPASENKPKRVSPLCFGCCET